MTPPWVDDAAVALAADDGTHRNHLLGDMHLADRRPVDLRAERFRASLPTADSLGVDDDVALRRSQPMPIASASVYSSPM